MPTRRCDRFQAATNSDSYWQESSTVLPNCSWSRTQQEGSTFERVEQYTIGFGRPLQLEPLWSSIQATSMKRLSLATRIIVVHDGQVARSPLDRTSVGRAMLGLVN